MPKKKSSQTLSDSLFSFEDTVVLMLKTNLLSYQFTPCLNKVCKLNMTRVKNLSIGKDEHPCFIYYDQATRLAYVLLESPLYGHSSKIFDKYEKMLLVRGRDAWDFLSRFYTDITSNRPEPDKNDVLEHRHWDEMNQLAADIFDLATFSLGGPQGRRTSLYPNTDTPMPTAINNYLNTMQQFLKMTFDELEWHLSNEEEYL